MNEKRVYSIPEAAELLGIGRNTAYAAAAESGELGGVSVIHVGRRLLISKAALDNVLAGNGGSERTAPEHDRS